MKDSPQPMNGMAIFLHPMSPAEIHLAKKCPLMRRLIKAHGPADLEVQMRPPYEALVTAVSHQQLHGKAAMAILNRFIALFPGVKFPNPAQLLSCADETLRACGFSMSKILALRDIAAKTQSGLVPTAAAARKLSNEELVQRLVALRGVGRWTVEMLLIFTLGRENVFPADDFGVRAGYRAAMKMEAMPRPKHLLVIAEKWQPYRTMAAWYLWRAADGAKSVKDTDVRG